MHFQKELWISSLYYKHTIPFSSSGRSQSMNEEHWYWMIPELQKEIGHALCDFYSSVNIKTTHLLFIGTLNVPVITLIHITYQNGGKKISCKGGPWWRVPFLMLPLDVYSEIVYCPCQPETCPLTFQLLPAFDSFLAIHCGSRSLELANEFCSSIWEPKA